MVTIATKDLQGFLNEAGGHRIQRVPPTERRGRIHTSTVTVSVLLGKQRIGPTDERKDEDFAYRWFSGTGKGGQHRNKHQNCLEITHLPTGLKRSATGRSREANIRDASFALNKALDDIGQAYVNNQINDLRSSQIGCGMRGDKRRTYRFQDDMVVDHENGKKVSCTTFMAGNIDRLW